MNVKTKDLKELAKHLISPLYYDKSTRIVYSTDASAYSEMPLAVCILKEERDIPVLIDFARTKHTTLIPRAAGTSLAGQVVGDGIVIDVSVFMNKIPEINPDERWVRVQSGVVLDTLNNVLKPYNLFFAPETSTSNRCCIGGMVGNNSCGSHSLVYGSVREHLLEAIVYLANGEKVTLTHNAKLPIDYRGMNDLEAEIYKHIAETYNNQTTKALIAETFPDPEVSRRNNGYALDKIINADNTLNLTALLSGSEGTLAFATEFKLKLMPLPPKKKALLCVHFSKLEDAFSANLIALKHKPFAVELMDFHIVEAAERNIAQRQNMFFIEGKPQAILIIEFANDDLEALNQQISSCVENMKQHNFGYAYPIVFGDDINKVWALRKAGLGLLTNVAGSSKPVSVIEDTAVAPSGLPEYMKEFKTLLNKYNLSCVYHAHIATGELHLRPVLNLKNPQDVILFRTIAEEVALLVRKYRGSLSGEHGDGRLRGAFIPLMYGEQVYDLMKQMKQVWDRDSIFNKGKIIDTPPMNENLRYAFDNYRLKDIKTYYNFDLEQGLLAAIEQCNGSADCRKAVEFGGTMCPSYRAMNDERFTPRARANIMRTLLSNPKYNNPFADRDIYFLLDNCLSCKGCKAECPSNVDIARLKSEYLQHYYKHYGYPLSVLLINLLPSIQRIGSWIPQVYNFVISNTVTSWLLKGLMSFSQKRQLPKLHKYTMRSAVKTLNANNTELNYNNKPTIYLFADEFSNFNDADVGFTTAKLFVALGYCVKIAPIRESGRIAISKGMVKRAKRIAKYNIRKIKDLNGIIVGIEPSAVLSFRDEYPLLCNEDLKPLNDKILLYDEFICQEIDKGNIYSGQFTENEAQILLHGHCQQKALIGIMATEQVLSLPKNYKVDVIPSGCCGMAGSFGYEQRHYEMSKAIAHQILIPAVKNASKDTIIAVVGTSCRDQIRHFAPERKPQHPLQILYDALIKI
ncbi:MAG: FAD-binding protein [Bacteroidales bacterium]|jgi:FAD/FMN-containing dehydrogenase/Fe-S oxidoreductase|nr:FAD-binding protein [Bacteroidales bacterium]